MQYLISASKSSMSTIEWKWTFGSPHEKSLRTAPKIKSKPAIHLAIDNRAHAQSLRSEEETWAEWNTPTENKREEVYTKMAEREMLGQVGRNPFMSDHSYADDVNAQVDFLTPMNTKTEETANNTTARHND